jgi:transposase
MAAEATDLRKSIPSLGELTQDILKKDPYSGHLFVFTNKQQNKIKILYWHNNGFCLWYKKLDFGRFELPEKKGSVYIVTSQKLKTILEGADIVKTKGKLAIL